MIIKNEYVENVLGFLKDKKETNMYKTLNSLYKKSQERIEKLMIHGYTKESDTITYRMSTNVLASDMAVHMIYQTMHREYKSKLGNIQLSDENHDMQNKFNIIARMRDVYEQPIGAPIIKLIKNDNHVYMARLDEFLSDKLEEYYDYTEGIPTLYKIVVNISSSLLITDEEKKLLEDSFYVNYKKNNNIDNSYLQYVLSKTTMNNIVPPKKHISTDKPIALVNAFFGNDKHDYYINANGFTDYEDARKTLQTILNLFKTNELSFLSLTMEDMHNIVVERATKEDFTDDELELLLIDSDIRFVDRDTTRSTYLTATNENYYTRKYIGIENNLIINLNTIISFQLHLKAILLSKKGMNTFLLTKKYPSIQTVNVEIIDKNGEKYSNKCSLEDMINDPFIEGYNERGIPCFVADKDLSDYDVTIRYRNTDINISNSNNNIYQEMILKNESIVHKDTGHKYDILYFDYVLIENSFDKLKNNKANKGFQQYIVRKTKRALYKNKKTLTDKEIEFLMLILMYKEPYKNFSQLLNEAFYAKTDFEFLALIKNTFNNSMMFFKMVDIINDYLSINHMILDSEDELVFFYNQLTAI